MIRFTQYVIELSANQRIAKVWPRHCERSEPIHAAAKGGGNRAPYARRPFCHRTSGGQRRKTKKAPWSSIRRIPISPS